MLWTGSLPGTASDFDESDFLRQRDGTDSDEESAQTQVDQAADGRLNQRTPGQQDA